VKLKGQPVPLMEPQSILRQRPLDAKI